MEAHPRVTVALERVKGLFLEAPDARFSVADAVRLSGIDDSLCSGILRALEDVRFLQYDGDGMYRRRVFDLAVDPPLGRQRSVPA